MKKYNLIIISLFVISTLMLSCTKENIRQGQMKEEFYLRNGDADMPVFMRGNPESKTIILYLHGGPGGESTSSIYTNAFLQLQEKYKIAFLDQRQQGNAHGKTKLKDISFDNFTEDVFLLTQVLKKRYGEDSRIYILGHSWGGTLGTGFMINESYQQEVEGYIQVAGAYDLPLLGKSVVEMVNEIGNEQINQGKDVAKWQKMITDINKTNEDGLTSDEILKLGSYANDIWQEKMLTDEIFDIPSAIKFAEEPKDVDVPVYPKAYDMFGALANVWAIIKVNYGKGGLMEKVLELSMADELYKIKKPTLLIWGKYDFTVPPKLGEVALQNIGASEKSLKIYEHSGHVPMASDPDRFVKDVSEFIDNN
ncbi:MAG: alpha/beta fold hydrolase [Flavobacteriales bacterium]|nr:alpha/beta fold hydrolase [Flavobacteriales bacterium]